jgi:acyl-CoA thioesterase superfamily protein/acyl-Coa thioesterase superfamily protein
VWAAAPAQPRLAAWHPSDVGTASADFAAASAVTAVGPSDFRAVIPDAWQQGRGAFGGLVLATLLRAIEKSEPDGTRVTRTLTGDLSGPVLPGPVDIQVRSLRRGNNQSNLAAELTQAGVVLATATAVLSPPRLPTRAVPPFVPTAPGPSQPWSDLALLDVGAPVGPVFTQHYEYRSLAPAFGGAADASIDGWIRERAPLARLDAPALVGRLDAWWPTLFALDSVPRPMATISFTAEILVDPASLPPAEALRYRARMAALHDGFFVELRELWHGDRVVALNQQTFAILR